MKITIHYADPNFIRIYLNVLEFSGSPEKLDITYTDFDYPAKKAMIKRVSEKNYTYFYVEEMDDEE